MKDETPPPRVIETDSLHSFDYSHEEEKHARRKVDCMVLPLIVLCFLMLQFVGQYVGKSLTSRTVQTWAMLRQTTLPRVWE